MKVIGDKVTGSSGKLMKCQWRFRVFGRVGLASCLLVFTACSYSTNFVIVNSSNSTITVRYKLKKNEIDNTPERLTLPVTPGVTKISELGKQTAWTDLLPAQYGVDPTARTVTVSILPGDALRIEHRNLVDGPQDEAFTSRNFAIEEIHITGARGEINLTGEQARTGFVTESKSLATVTYR